MKTLRDEDFIIDTYQKTTNWTNIKFIGRFFPCYRVMKLTKSFLFKNSWKESYTKDALPPDFHNDRHHIMMEVMRVDDSVNNKVTSFERDKRIVKEQFGMNINDRQDLNFYFIPDTRDSNKYNFKGYYDNFKRVINHHSEKVELYQNNYPKCKKVIFFICDESNNYIQVSKKEDLKREDEKNVKLDDFMIHMCYLDSKFVDIIRNCQADYVIWYGYYKAIYVNGKLQDYPRAVIYDVKHIKRKFYDYEHSLMFKVKEEERYKNKN